MSKRVVVAAHADCDRAVKSQQREPLAIRSTPAGVTRKKKKKKKKEEEVDKRDVEKATVR